MTEGVAGLLRKLRRYMVTGVLLAFLFVVEFMFGAAVSGCGTGGDDKALYGPAPSDLQETDISSDQVPQQDAVPRTYYGPFPVDASTDIPQDLWGGDQALYGAPLVDTVEDSVQPQDDMGGTYYGPPPVDAVEDAVDASDVEMTLYGPMPVDVIEGETRPEDTMQAWYGPPT